MAHCELCSKRSKCSSFALHSTHGATHRARPRKDSPSAALQIVSPSNFSTAFRHRQTSTRCGKRKTQSQHWSETKKFSLSMHRRFAGPAPLGGDKQSLKAASSQSARSQLQQRISEESHELLLSQAAKSTSVIRSTNCSAVKTAKSTSAMRALNCSSNKIPPQKSFGSTGAAAPL